MAQLFISTQDKRWADVVRRYVEARLPVAESRLADPLLGSYRAFCSIWQGRYDLGNRTRAREYRRLTEQERRALYLRFVRQCRSWESTIRIWGQGQTALTTGSSVRSIGGRLRQLRERQERASAFYAHLAEEARSQTRALTLPWLVREAYDFLHVPAGAPMAEVRRRYHRLAVKHHPDRQGDADTMSRLSRAYRYIVEYHKTVSS